MAFFRNDGNFIYATAPLEFYIPKYYFDDAFKFAENQRDSIKVLGVFDVGVLKNGKVVEMKLMNLPTWIEVFTSVVEERSVELPNEEEKSTTCVVCKYMPGEKVMNSTLVKDSANVEAFMNFVLKGKIPAILKYGNALDVWIENQSINNAFLGVHDVSEEMILANSYRYKKDPSKKFAHVIGKNPSISEYDYVMINIRQICQYTSTFTALTFEDMDSMVTTSINRARTNSPEAYSPIEELIKM